MAAVAAVAVISVPMIPAISAPAVPPVPRRGGPWQPAVAATATWTTISRSEAEGRRWRGVLLDRLSGQSAAGKTQMAGTKPGHDGRHALSRRWRGPLRPDFIFGGSA